MTITAIDLEVVIVKLEQALRYDETASSSGESRDYLVDIIKPQIVLLRGMATHLTTSPNKTPLDIVTDADRRAAAHDAAWAWQTTCEITGHTGNDEYGWKVQIMDRLLWQLWRHRER